MTVTKVRISRTLKSIILRASGFFYGKVIVSAGIYSDNKLIKTIELDPELDRQIFEKARIKVDRFDTGKRQLKIKANLNDGSERLLWSEKLKITQ